MPQRPLTSQATTPAAQAALRASLDALLKAEGLDLPPPASADLERRDVEMLLAAYRAGDLATLGPYGAQLIESLHMSPAGAAALAAMQAAAYPLFDGTGKVGRYLLMISQALQDQVLGVPANLLFAEYPTHQFNACVVSTPDGDLCLMNTGLLQLLYHVSVAANHAYDRDDRLGPTGSSSVKRAAALVLAVVAQYLGAGSHTHAMDVGEPLPADALYDATALAYAMRLFVMAHEVGHVVLGHTRRPEGGIRMPALAEGVSIARGVDDEFAADRFAQDLLLRVDDQRRFAEPVAAGGLGFLLVHAIVMEVATKLGVIKPEDAGGGDASHPPTMLRIRRLDEHLTSRYGAGSRQALSGCVVLQRVLIALETCEIDTSSQSVRLVWPRR